MPELKTVERALQKKREGKTPNLGESETSPLWRNSYV